jgi:hypothetical protein
VQLLLSGLLLIQTTAAASPADQAGLKVICTHDPAAAPPTTPVLRPRRISTANAWACTCPQLAKLVARLPTPPLFVVLRPRSHALHAYADAGVTEPTSPSPDASRAPPFSA